MTLYGLIKIERVRAFWKEDTVSPPTETPTKKCARVKKRRASVARAKKENTLASNWLFLLKREGEVFLGSGE